MEKKGKGKRKKDKDDSECKGRGPRGPRLNIHRAYVLGKEQRLLIGNVGFLNTKVVYRRKEKKTGVGAASPLYN